MKSVKESKRPECLVFIFTKNLFNNFIERSEFFNKLSFGPGPRGRLVNWLHVCSDAQIFILHLCWHTCCVIERTFLFVWDYAKHNDWFGCTDACSTIVHSMFFEQHTRERELITVIICGIFFCVCEPMPWFYLAKSFVSKKMFVSKAGKKRQQAD